MDLSTSKSANLVADQNSPAIINKGGLQDRLHENMKENRAMRGESSRPGRSWAISRKIEAIDTVRAGNSKASVARSFGVPESTLRGWCKAEFKIRGMYEHSSTAESEDEGPVLKKIKSEVPDFELPENHPNNSVRLVENGHRYTKKILPPAAAAPATPVPAYPNMRLSTTPVVNESKNGVTGCKKKMDDALWLWLLQQKSQILGHQPAQQSTNQLRQDRPWFWQWYKECMFPTSTAPVTQHEEVNNSKKKELDADIPATREEALAHGEKFLKWLETCSNPLITRFQLMQVKYLVDSLASEKQKRTLGCKQSRK